MKAVDSSGRHPRLILAGGGEAEDSRPLDELFATWIGPQGKMLYLPVAMKDSQHPCESCLAWIRSIFTPLGVLNIEMWTDFHWPQDICIDRRNGLAYVVESHMHKLFPPRVTVRDLKGKVLSEFGGYEHEGKGVLENSHTICVDSRGDIYIGDIVKVRRLMKFARVN